MSAPWIVTGGTGLVGRFIVEDLLARDLPVLVMGRRPPLPGFFSRPVGFRPFDLGGADAADLTGAAALVHCAFDHVPGRYRGGEGDDPAGFLQRNVLGSVVLFEAARQAGLARGIFLSSRAVYGAYPAGTLLTEALEPRPDTLYGEAKRAVEVALAALDRPGFATASLRATGVYGPAGPEQHHKWADLFTRHLAGASVSPRAATEVHGADLARALWLAAAGQGGQIWNVSDLTLDLHDLLAAVNHLTGCPHPPPPRAQEPVSAMDCSRLRAAGWQPGGWDGLVGALPALLAAPPQIGRDHESGAGAACP